MLIQPNDDRRWSSWPWSEVTEENVERQRESKRRLVTVADVERRYFVRSIPSNDDRYARGENGNSS